MTFPKFYAEPERLPCTDRACDRELNHPGLHMSRTWDAHLQSEIIDEWGHIDLAAFTKPKTITPSPQWSPYP